MPVAVDWYPSTDNIIVYEFIEGWTWQEFHAAIDRAIELSHQVEHTVYYIANVHKTESIPRGALRQVKSIMSKMPANWGATIVVQHNLFVKTLAESFTRIYPKYGKNFPVVSSMEAAIALVEELQRAVA